MKNNKTCTLTGCAEYFSGQQEEGTKEGRKEGRKERKLKTYIFK
jgi:hypothetical protein